MFELLNNLNTYNKKFNECDLKQSIRKAISRKTETKKTQG